MSIRAIQLSKTWRDPVDFKRYQFSEANVRDDIQYLFDELAGAINGVVDDIKDAGASEIGFTDKSLGANVEEAISNIMSSLPGTVQRITYFNGTFFITHTDRTIETIDTNIERLFIGIDYDPETQSLQITREDGSTVDVSLSDFITEYEFEDTETVTFSVDHHKVSAQVSAQYLADLSADVRAAQTAAASAAAAQAAAEQAVSDAAAAGGSAESAVAAAQGYAGSAQTSANSAANAASAASGHAQTANDNALLSKSYAVGGTGVRTGENTDNAKYYKEQAAQLIAQAGAGDMAKSVYDPDNVGAPVAFKSDLTSLATTNNTTLTGVPKAPTAPAGTSTVQIATTEFVSTAVSNAVGAIVIPPGTTSLVVTLDSSSWVNDSQTAVALGVDQNSNVVVAPDAASAKAYAAAGILCTAQGQDTLTFTCDSVPTATLTVNVLIV